jgi:hypothetical protein
MSLSSEVEPTKRMSMLVLLAVAGRVISPEFAFGAAIELFARSWVARVSQVPEALVFH